MQFKFVVKLFLILSLIGILPLLLSSLVSFSIIKDSLGKSTFSNLKRMNDLVSFEIENIMAQSFDNIAVLSRDPILASKETTKEEKETELEKIRKYYPLFKDITILNKDGEVIISTTYLFYGGWSTNSWFLEARREKEIVASDMYAILDPQNPILAFFAPVLDEKGEVISFIVAQIDTDFLWNVISFKIGENGYGFLINSLGDIIIHPQRSLLFEKITSHSDYSLKENTLLKMGTIKLRFQNENFLASFNVIENYKGYPGHNWHLILIQPEKEALSLVDIIKKQIYIFLIVSLALILLISFALGRYITGPLKKLTLGAKEVAAGNLETQVEIKTKDEFEELANTFNEMIKDLRNYQASLEESKNVLEVKVAARTQELKELTEHLEEQVKERTKELQERIDELERFHKLTVGRELKMVELKEEIEKLKKELKKSKS